ncbi:MAG TPA: DUF1931 family protein [archaeon]|nr:DUF1931 family protein [archaeon]
MGKALVVKSAVKAACKGMRCSGDFMGAMDKKVAELLADASKRAKANGRATIRPADL